MWAFLLNCIRYTTVILLGTATIASAQPVNDAALMGSRPAKMLSEYGLFADAPNQLPNDRVIAYDLQVPLFTDYAEKYRFAYVPDGQPATYDVTEVFTFPVGSVLVKTFAYPADFQLPDENIRLIETRLLIHQEAGWNAWTYIWNDEQTDAVLKVAGKVLPVDFVDASGQAQSITYVVPNKNQCKGCHTFDKAVTPIGPKARNLNKTIRYQGEEKEQMVHWSDTGLLVGAPDLNEVPRVPASDDMTAPLEDRARAYLDINCAHCHRREGPGSTSGLFLTYHEPNPTAWGYEKRPVAAGRGSGGLDYDIQPGDAAASIIHFRMASTDPGIMMPEVGRSSVHTEGLALIRDWINQMK